MKKIDIKSAMWAMKEFVNKNILQEEELLLLNQRLSKEYGFDFNVKVGTIVTDVENHYLVYGNAVTALNMVGSNLRTVKEDRGVSSLLGTFTHARYLPLLDLRDNKREIHQGQAWVNVFDMSLLKDLSGTSYSTSLVFENDTHAVYFYRELKGYIGIRK